MAIPRRLSVEAETVVDPQLSLVKPKSQARWLMWADRLMLLLLVGIAALIPQSIKGAYHGFEISLVFWLVMLVLSRRKLLPQSLAAPMLAYLGWAALSTILSPAPVASWDRMKLVCILLLAVVVAQNVRTARQVKLLVSILLLTGAVSAALTAWQYMDGIGILVKNPTGAVALAGVAPGDVVESVNGKSIHNVSQLQQAAERSTPGSTVLLRVIRAGSLERVAVSIKRDDLVRSQFFVPQAQYPRARPVRAQGYLKHYVVYAEVLMQLALLAWGLLLAALLARKRLAWILALTFGAITLTVAATDTRSALGGIFVAAFAVMMLVMRRKGRIIGLAGFTIALIAGTAWILHTRGYFWVDPRDIGSQYRWMVWHDGFRLIREHPWFGVGMDSVKLFGTAWSIQAYRVFHVQGHFHSNFIQLAVERGLPALAAWVWLVMAYFLMLWRLLKRTSASQWFIRGAVLGLGASMIGLLIDSVVQYSLGEAPVLILMWFSIGLALALDRVVREQPALKSALPESTRPELVRN